MKKYEVIVVGGGPAGVITALNCKKSVLIIEKNSSLLRKLLISGGGQCNFTNSAKMDEFLKAFGKEQNWLKPAIYNFDNQKIIEYLKTLGVDSFVREDGKVFPASFKSIDIINALENEIRKHNISIEYYSDIISINKQDENFFIETERDNFVGKFLVLATGGKSYPNTGSNGDGYLFAKKFNHKIIQPKSALTHIVPYNYKFKELAGITLKNMNIKHKKKLYSGDLLFAHNWLTGPIIIDNSKYFNINDTLTFNFVGKSFDEFFQLLQEEKNSNIILKTMLKRFLPERFLFHLLEKELLHKKLRDLSKKNMTYLANLFTQYEIKIKKMGDFHTGMVTHGGVDLKEVYSKTMESKLVKNLFFAGEILNYDAISGGYNIHAAFATGFLAGDSIRKK